MFVERMTGNIKAERLFLVSQRFLLRPLIDRRIGLPGLLCAFARRTEHGEDIDLIARLIALMRLPDLHGVVQRAGHARARNLRGIEGAAFDQALDHPPIDRRHIDAPAKIEERLERTVVATALENHFDGFFADIFHARHAKTNLAAHRREIGQAFVDVRRQDLDVLVAALGEILNHLVGIAHLRASKARP